MSQVESRTKSPAWCRERADAAMYFAYGWNHALANRGEDDDTKPVDGGRFSAWVYKHECTPGARTMSMQAMFRQYRQETHDG